MATEGTAATTTQDRSGEGGARSPLRGTAREQAILDAVVELVAEVGYERITVDAIAARARASKATMYRRWPGGKPEIVADALRRGRSGGDAVAVPDTGGLRGDLLATVAAITQTFTGTAGPSLVGLLEAVRDHPALRELIASQIAERSAEVGRTVVGRALARGEDVRADSSVTVIDVAFSQMLFATLFRGAAPGPAAQERLVDDVLLPLLRRPDRPRPHR